jgi:hypothetical protein
MLSRQSLRIRCNKYDIRSLWVMSPHSALMTSGEKAWTWKVTVVIWVLVCVTVHPIITLLAQKLLTFTLHFSLFHRAF